MTGLFIYTIFSDGRDHGLYIFGLGTLHTGTGGKDKAPARSSHFNEILAIGFDLVGGTGT